MPIRIPSLLLLVILIVFPYSALAASSKTYTISSAAAQNYTTSGTTSLTTKATTSWFNPSYSHRLTLTINKEHIGEELTDFPILVRLTSDQTHLFNTSRDDGHDLVFTDKNNQKLSHELESFDKQNNEATIWVKVPTLKPTEDTVLYLYYGNPTAEDNQNTTDVWSNGYKGVWHMSQSPVATQEDVTANKNDAAPVNLDEQDSRTAGKIGDAVRLVKSSSDYMSAADDNLHGEHITVSTWFNSKTWNTNFADVLNRRNASGIGNGGFVIEQSSVSGFLWFYCNIGGTWIAKSASGWPVGEWVNLTGTYDGHFIRLYRNGEEIGSTAAEGSISNPGNARVEFGRNISATSIFFDGSIDQTSVSNTPRSSAWISAEYANQSGSEDFFTISSPTSTSNSSSIITLKPTKALHYSSLSKFIPNGEEDITYQLSPNAGETWYYYTKAGWTKTSANTPAKSSSANDINAHLKTFPEGTGKLLWRAILQPNSTLDSIKVDYIQENSTDQTTIINKVDTLFKLVFGANPTTEQHTYWEGRLKDKTTLPALFGAMQWQKLFGQ